MKLQSVFLKEKCRYFDEKYHFDSTLLSTTAVRCHGSFFFLSFFSSSCETGLSPRAEGRERGQPHTQRQNGRRKERGWRAKEQKKKNTAREASCLRRLWQGFRCLVRSVCAPMCQKGKNLSGRLSPTTAGQPIIGLSMQKLLRPQKVCAAEVASVPGYWVMFFFPLSLSLLFLRFLLVFRLTAAGKDLFRLREEKKKN